MRKIDYLFTQRVWVTVTLLICQISAKIPMDDKSLKYYQTPMHEILQNDLYVGMTQYGEYAVTYTGKGSDVKVTTPSSPLSPLSLTL